MDIDKVRALSDAELGSELATQRRHLYDLRFQLATRQLTDHTQLTGARRTIARLLTVATERGLDENDLVRQAAPAEPRKPATRGSTRTTAARKTTARKRTAPSATGGDKE